MAGPWANHVFAEVKKREQRTADGLNGTLLEVKNIVNYNNNILSDSHRSADDYFFY